MRSALCDAGLGLLLLLGPACPGPSPGSGDKDLNSGQGGRGDMRAQPDSAAAEDLRPRDMAGRDLSPPPDLQVVDLVPPPDLARPPDLSPFKLNPPDCSAFTQNPKASDFFGTLVMAKCSGGGNFCHVNGGMAGMLAMGNSADTFRNALVNKDSSKGVKYVVPGDIDKSFLLAKLLNRQNDMVPFGGGPMPQGDVLIDGQKCIFINWVKSGAN